MSQASLITRELDFLTENSELKYHLKVKVRQGPAVSEAGKNTTISSQETPHPKMMHVSPKMLFMSVLLSASFALTAFFTHFNVMGNEAKRLRSYTFFSYLKTFQKFKGLA